jgi:hypothetical protein
VAYTKAIRIAHFTAGGGLHTALGIPMHNAGQASRCPTLWKGSGNALGLALAIVRSPGQKSGHPPDSSGLTYYTPVLMSPY